MSQIWYPPAIKDPFKDSGPMMDTPWRGVLHTTEGKTYAGAAAAYAKGVAPHFTVSFETGKFKVWQHIPINRSARSLSNISGGVETNRTRCVQIEVVAFAATAGTLQREYLDGIGKLMRWVEANTTIKRTAPKFYTDTDGIVLARDTSPIRMSPVNWLKFNGWCGHQHVPENSHWDPGAIDMAYLMGVNIGVRPVIDPPLDLNDVVHVKRDKYTDGVYILQKDGAIFAFEGAVFYMGVNGQGFFQGREAAQILWPEEATARDGGKWDGYKYIILATSGEMYGCPWR